MANYMGIQITGLTTSDYQTESVIMKLVSYLEIYILPIMISLISLVSNHLVITTQKDREFKTSLREEIIEKGLGITVNIVSGQYQFIIPNMNELDEKSSNVEIITRKMNAIYRNT